MRWGTLVAGFLDPGADRQRQTLRVRKGKRISNEYALRSIDDERARRYTGRMRQRLDYIDGLRGLAVFMVVVLHSADYDFLGVTSHTAGFRIVFTHLAIQGYQGVSLFLVISGFCLALPAFQRQISGRSDWFSVRRFAARRCWRILPPYYAALLLSVILALNTRGTLIPQLTTPHPGLLDIVAHVALVQNLTPYVGSINGPFWSLALEWQWYIAFPLVLYGMLRWPRSTLATCFALACGWHLVTHDAGYAFHQFSAVLPGRLFEFSCGVGVARLAASGWQPPRRFNTLLGWAIVLPICLMIVPPLRAGISSLVGPAQPLIGLQFGALVLLASNSTRVRRILSWRPLVRLGLISYSVYLIHDPVIVLVQPWFWLVFHQWLIVTLLGIAVGITAGATFYLAVERYFVRYPSNLISWLDQQVRRKPGGAQGNALPEVASP